MMIMAQFKGVILTGKFFIKNEKKKGEDVDVDCKWTAQLIGKLTKKGQDKIALLGTLTG